MQGKHARRKEPTSRAGVSKHRAGAVPRARVRGMKKCEVKWKVVRQLPGSVSNRQGLTAGFFDRVPEARAMH